MGYLGNQITTVFPTSISVDSATIKGDTTIGDASAADKKILFDGNAQDFHIGLDDSSDSLTIGLGSALGATSHIVIDANGHITKPKQPAFSAYLSGTQSNIAVGSDVTISFAAERFDQNADFNTSNYTFTAPVTGKYLLSVSVQLANTLDSAANYYQVKIVTSNTTYRNVLDPDFGQDNLYFPLEFSVLADMDAADTAIIQVNQTAGSQQTNVDSQSHFTGHLVC